MTVFKTFWKILNKNKITVIIYTIMLLIFGASNMQTSEKSMSFVESKPDVLIINNDEEKGITKDLIKYITDNSNIIDIEKTEEKINDALQVINAIRYAKTDIDDLENFIMCRQYGISKCIYNDDWYLLVTNDGEICGDYLSNDFRAEKEFNVAVLEYQNQIKESNQEVKPLVLQYR